MEVIVEQESSVFIDLTLKLCELFRLCVVPEGVASGELIETKFTKKL